jgi:hypothetical protein
MTDKRTSSAISMSTTPLSDLRWLVRYVEHCGFFVGDDETMLTSLRGAMGGGGWRILCRTPKERFLPILRNRELSIHSLITYCQRLSEDNFVRAPRAALLDFFVTQRRSFFNLPCRIPQDDDYLLMRIADRELKVKTADIALVSNWVYQENVILHMRNKWTTLVDRAKRFRELQHVELTTRSAKPWYFFCHGMDWRGYQIEPIRNSAELWLEGMTHGTCLYKLRHECNALLPSRFFSVRRDGKRYATLELSWHPPRGDFIGMDRELGRWEIRDLRLSYNKLPYKHLREAMEGFAWMYSFWAKRPGRMPKGYIDDVRRRVSRLGRRQDRSTWQLTFPD